MELRFPDPASLGSAARLLDGAAADPDTLTLQVPGDGSIAFLRSLLNRLEGADIDAEGLSIHEADLDDVFFALTGHSAAPVAEGAPSPDQAEALP